MMSPTSSSEFLRAPITVGDLVVRQAVQQSTEVAFTFLADGEAEAARLTYQDLDRRARAVAAALSGLCEKGDRALLLYRPDLEFVTAFLGCLYAGVVAVPTYAPRRNRPDARLEGIAGDAQAAVALTTSEVLADVESGQARPPTLGGLRWLATDRLDDASSPAWTCPVLSGDSLAFLQYTSGSTSTPKGVMISHDNLLHNLLDLYLGFQHDAQSVMVTWLPTFHDLGLIYGVLLPIFGGFPCYMMPPAAFLQRPARWLEAITRYRGTHSAAPNFAYELCAAKVGPAERASLDLSSWRMGLNAAEPIRDQTLRRFATAFKECGLQFRTLTPGYGLAEATLKVATGRADQRRTRLTLCGDALAEHGVAIATGKTRNRQRLVGCGWSELETRTVIVDPDTRTMCPPEQVGEIWVSGASVAQGYWNRPDETRATFRARLADTGEGPFLRTGDLGFVRQGELYITGRLKEIVIVHGLNHYPQDIELSVQRCHWALRTDCGAAFSVEAEGEERLVVVQELERTALRQSLDMNKIVAAIRQELAEVHELRPLAVVLIRTATLPKTSSGKIQRSKCRAAFLDESLNVLWKWQESSAEDWAAPSTDAAASIPSSVAGAAGKSGEASRLPPLESSLRDRLAPWLKVPLARIDVHEPFARYGVDSVTAVQISGELGAWFGQPLSPTLLYDHPTISQLATHLAQLRAEATAGAAAEARCLAESIAIVGLACRFPGAAGPAEFWDLLRRGVDAITEVPGSRWDRDAVYDSQPDSSRISSARWGGFLPQVDRFDAPFFGIARREAELMDPQQRLLLELAWEALEHAGLPQVAGTPAGVFVGISGSDYGRLQAVHPAGGSAYAGTGTALSIAANRLSYFLDLRGPSVAVDTACSSSLVSLHQACQSLSRGECRLALAGGVNLLLTPDLTIAFSQAGMLSPDGRCRTFDAGANGYVRGEGGGLVVLKRLADAQRDGDRILAVVRGTAVNQDGRSNGLTAPNGPAQQAVVQQALASAGVAPNQIGYVETHGTGTPLGDPIEVNSLVAVLSADRRSDQPCRLGSVKTNIGHLESAAGIAGLIKVVLSLQHGQIPPHLHLQQLNPHIQLENSPFSVPVTLTEWTDLKGPRIAGVSSFGFGGTNAHAVVEEAPAQAKREAKFQRPLHLLTLSARSDRALRQVAAAWRKNIRESDDNLLDVCHTANAGRRHFERRIAIVAESPEQLQHRLAAYHDHPDSEAIIAGDVGRQEPGGIAFLFTGQGSQYAGMARQLYDAQPVFREAIEQCDEILRSQGERPLTALLYPTKANDRSLDATGFAQPALFAVEYALSQLWKSWGITPSAVLGHSVGEYAAACVAGVLGLDDALQLIARRASAMQQLPPGGIMAAVRASAERVAEVLSDVSPEVSIAAINGPSNTVISGDSRAVRCVLARFEDESVACHPLNTSHAFHSACIEPALAALREASASVKLAQPTIPLVSNLSGKMADASYGTPDYWCRHARQSVLFSRGIQTLTELGCRTFVEIGPSPMLLGMGRECVAQDGLLWLPSLRPQQSDWQQMFDSLARLYVWGASVDWQGFDRPYAPRRLSMPNYPFQRKRYWLPTTPQTGSASDDWFYRVEWQTVPQPPAPAAPSADRSETGNGQYSVEEAAAGEVPCTRTGMWLIFADSTGVGAGLARQLERHGQEYLLVAAGASRQRLDDRNWTIDRSEPADYAWLFDEIGRNERPVAAMVHLWGAESCQRDSGAAFESCLDQAQVAGCESVLLLAQALARHDIPSCRLYLVTRGAADLEPEESLPGYADAGYGASQGRHSGLDGISQAPLWGFGQVLILERPEWSVRMVDLPPAPSETDIELLWTELADAASEAQTAWRDGQRRVPRLVRSAVTGSGPPQLRADASYLVTGGLGALGLQVARWLVQHGARSLVLCGRREPTEEAHRTLSELREAGVNVVTICADVGCRADVQRLLEQARQTQPLRGIVHAAGIVAQRRLDEADRDHLREVLHPKIRGAWLLHELSQTDPLDFFVCFSSIAAVWGSAGQGPYAAGNRFLDSLVHFRRRRGLPALSVNWGPWSGGGMASDTDLQRLVQMGVSPLSTRQSLSALGRLMGSAACQRTVADVDWARFRDLYQARGQRRLLDAIEVFGNEEPAGDSNSLRPTQLARALADADAARRRQLFIAHVQEEVRRVLCFDADDDVPVQRGFFELGIDSLMAVELKDRLAQSLGCRFPATLLLDHGNVAKLADFVLDRIGATPDIATSERVAAVRAPVDVDEPIALVALGCRFPGGAHDAESFWDLLLRGTDAVGPVPPNRWDARTWYRPERASPGAMYTQAGGFLDQEAIERFDAAFFGISPREAISLDPQQRLLLTVGYEALEQAASAGDRGICARTGVFIGVTNNDYGQLLLQGGFDRLDPYFVTGNSLNAAAGRLSYFLGLQGPSLTVDTACSSSLVAVHLACQSLRQGECDQALAGGVNLILSPAGMIATCQSQMLSADGRCKTFDASADGYGRGEGCGVVVLKRLSDALAAGNKIWAVVRGSAVNQDGAGSGFTVPNGPAQESLFRETLARAGVEPDQLDYMEAHGTGTALGDPIEMRALGEVYCRRRNIDQSLWVGSVKTNLGHLESAAGIAGLIKTALMLRAGLIPPHLHFRNPNPHIPWDEFLFRVPNRIEPWPSHDRPRLAGISSFGFSGTNAHVVLEQAPAQAPAAIQPDRPAHVLVISAKSQTALVAQVGRMAEYLQTDRAVSLADVCFTANTRSHHRFRAAVVAGDVDEAIWHLREFRCVAFQPADSDKPAQGIFLAIGDDGPLPRLLIRDLYNMHWDFRRRLEECDALLESWTGIHFRDALLDHDDDHQLPLPAAHGFAFCLQVGMARLLQDWGLRPTRVLGQGVGHFAAAYLAGVFKLEDGLRLVVERTRGLEDTDGPASGRWQAFDAAVSQITFRQADMGLVCGRTGRALGRDVSNAAYWRASVRDDSMTCLTAAALSNASCDVVLEIGTQLKWEGPQPNVVQRRGGRWLNGLAGADSDGRSLAGALAELYVRGAEIDWRAFDRDFPRHCVDLPTYPFYVQANRYWPPPITPTAGPPAMRRGPEAMGGHGAHPLLGARRRSPVPRPEIEFEVRLHPTELPYLTEHRIFDTTLLPFAVVLELAIAAGRDAVRSGRLAVEDIEILEPIPVDAIQGVQLYVVLGPIANADFLFRVFRAADAEDSDKAAEPDWTLSARGRLSPLPQRGGNGQPAAHADMAGLRKSMSREISGEQFYRLCRNRGIHLCARFPTLDRLWQDDGRALAEVRLPDSLSEQTADYQWHPVLLDACLQAAGAALPESDDDPWLLAGIERFLCERPPATRLLVHAQLRRAAAPTAGTCWIDLRIFTGSGDVVAEAVGVRMSRAAPAASVPVADDNFYEVEWVLDERGPVMCLPTAPEIAEPLFRETDNWRQRPDLLEFCESLEHIESLSARLAESALRQLGWFPSSGECFAVENLAEQLSVTRSHSALLGRMLELCEQSGLLRRHAQRWECVRGPAGPDPRADLAALLARYPAMAMELDLLDRCTAGLPAVLRGECDPNDLLFPGGDHSLLAKLYQNSVSARAMNHLVARAVGEIVRRWPAGQQLRVLEIGAGTGATTAYVLSELSAEHTEYVLTDVDSAFTDSARTRFGEFKFLSSKLLNIEQDPASQGFAGKEFDLILAANVMHATRDVRESLRHTGQLLADGGFLVLLEGTSPLAWLDLTFGLTAAWWKFRDRQLRPSHPLLSQSQWKDVLVSAGFEQPVAIPKTAAHQTTSLSQSVLVARHSTTAARQKRTRSGQWLIFADEQGVADRLVDELKASGATCAVVTRGDAWESWGSDRFVVNHRRAADYDRLLATVGKRATPIRGVVYLWGLDTNIAQDANTADVDKAAEVGCRSALLLVQSLIKLESADPPNLWLVTRGAISTAEADPTASEDPVAIAQSVIWGLGKVVAREHSEFRCALVDLDPNAGDEIGQLLEEIEAEHGAADGRVLFRDRRRYAARVRRSDPQPAGLGQVIAADRTYLVVGGLGEIGVQVCRRLVDLGARHLVIASRRPADYPFRDTIALWEQMGASIHVRQADVSRYGELSGLFEEIERDLPPLAGVIHAAGVFDDRLVTDHEWELFEKVFAAKVQGAWNLHLLTAPLDLDFFVLFSTVSTLWGTSGLANYVAANEFLDALAGWRRRRGLPGLSINWGPWQGVGMANLVGDDRMAEWSAMGMRPLETEEALDALSRCLTASQSQLAVMAMDWQRMRAHPAATAYIPLFGSLLNSPSRDAASFRRQIEAALPGEQRGILAGHVRSLVQRVLGWDAEELVSMSQGFFDLGMDSLRATELRNLLQSSLECSLPPTLTFKFPTIAMLVDHLAREVLALDDEIETTPGLGNGMSPELADPAEIHIGEIHTRLSDELAQLEELLKGRRCAPHPRNDATNVTTHPRSS